MDPKNIIREIADKNLLYIKKNGHAQAGINGPYKNVDTPVRNSAHWIITYSWLWKKTGEVKYCDAVCILASYLMRPENYGASGSVICRRDRRFDSTNGLIGQAWVIEGLICAAKMLQDPVFRKNVSESKDILSHLDAKILIQKSQMLFKVQRFDQKSSSWNVIDCDGTLDFDLTYNHHLWFAAAGSMILDQIDDPEIDKEIRAFLNASDDTLFVVNESGLIAHGLNRKLTDKERDHWSQIDKQRKVDDLLHNPFAIMKRKAERKINKFSFTYKLEEGYHLFDLYGFALLKKRYGNMPVFSSKKLKKAVQYALSGNLIDSLSVKTGEYPYNKFAYGYNSPAFEYPYIAVSFADAGSEVLTRVNKLFEEQCRLTYDEQKKSFRRSPDPTTLDARIYELVRFYELIDENFSEGDIEKKDIYFRPDILQGESRHACYVRKKKICFMTDSITELGGRQRITAFLVNVLSECDGLDVSLFCTSMKEKTVKMAYPISDKVHIINDKKISGNQNRYLLYKGFRFFNKNILHTANTHYLRRIYFPESEVKKYTSFFANHPFDVVVGIGTRQAAMLTLCFDLKGKHLSKMLDMENNGIRPKLIAWYHTPWNVYFRTPGIFQWRQEELYKCLLPKLDLHIVLTKGEQTRYKRELKSTKVKYIYNPLTFQSEKKSTTSGSKLLFVGRLDYDIKGLDYLAEIFYIVKKSIPDARLTVVGDGNGRIPFEQKIRSLGLRDSVFMAGQSSAVQEYYLESSICLVTSRQEGFGLVVTEAMECGLPVVSFKTEGPSEIIEDGINGYLIEKFDINTFADKVINLCLDEEKKMEMGIQAKERAKTFSVDTIKKEWMSLFR